MGAGTPAPVWAGDSDPIPEVRFARPFEFWRVNIGWLTNASDRSGVTSGASLRQFFTERWHLDLVYTFSSLDYDRAVGSSHAQILSSRLAIPLWIGHAADSGTIVLSAEEAGYNRVRVRYLEGLMPARWICSLVLGQSTRFSSTSTGYDAGQTTTPTRQATRIEAGVRMLYLKSGAIPYGDEARGGGNHAEATLLAQFHPSDSMQIAFSAESPHLLPWSRGGFSLGAELARSFPVTSGGLKAATSIALTMSIRLLEWFR